MERNNKMVTALILRAAGINCNDEIEQGFKMAGAKTEQLHISQLIKGEKELQNYDILALPGGFSYGDYITSGKILANQLTIKLGRQIQEFNESGKTILGICNGFQTLVKTGLLPGNGLKATLTNNDSGKFECRWIKMTRSNDSRLTKGLQTMEAPVAHGEGKFTAEEKTLKQLEENRQIIFRYSAATYPENPNGSLNNIAGISNKKGNIIGLMPHPERHLTSQNHPKWNRIKCTEGQGLQFFRNITEEAK